jgi:anti-sigma-K factor RskA
MRYDDPELRERLAAEYVLGTLPSRARRRFEQLMAADPGLARLAGAWADRLSPLDDTARVEEPLARVWQAVERRLGFVRPAAAPPPSWFHSWLGSLMFWRGLGLAGSLATATLAIYVAVQPRPVAPAVVAVLAGHGGAPGWVAVTGPGAGEVSFSAVAPASEKKPHAFELWGITVGAPRPLGLLPQHAGAVFAMPADRLPASGGVLAVSLEPPGGSPTGLPTGPVLFQGKVLTRPF